MGRLRMSEACLSQTSKDGYVDTPKTPLPTLLSW